MKPVEMSDRDQWRLWVREYAYDRDEMWLLFYKTHTDTIGIDYDARMEEVLCFGWNDSFMKRIDEDAATRGNSLSASRTVDGRSCSLPAT